MSNPPDVPKEVCQRLDAWERLWKQSARMHYVLGGLSVASSSVAAAIVGVEVYGYKMQSIASLLAAFASIFTALIGFLQPERRYMKFVRAWRVLDAAVLKFKLAKSDQTDLLGAVERGEALITEFEDKKL